MTHEDEVQQQYLEYPRTAGHANASVKDLGLVINLEDPCLTCSLDGLVDIPGKVDVLWRSKALTKLQRKD